jgi:tryptophan synthase alpha chain
MSRIAGTLADLRNRSQGGLVAYVTAGDPRPSCTPRIVESIARGGADIIEIGIPFSDPIADGPTIQAATVRALKAGTTPKKVLRISEEIKERTEIPLVVLTYYNLVFRMGLRNFFESAHASGIDGVIVPDLPIEEASEYRKFAEANQLDTIFLAAPSTSTVRLEKIVTYTKGFLYLVSVFGVTGAREKLQDLTIELIRKTLPVTGGKVPLAVGFGISKPEHVRTIIRNGADAAIVGSGFVRIIEQKRGDEERMLQDVREYANQLKAATVNKLAPT